VLSAPICAIILGVLASVSGGGSGHQLRRAGNAARGSSTTTCDRRTASAMFAAVNRRKLAMLTRLGQAVDLS
jgi:hypothetical protein